MHLLYNRDYKPENRGWNKQTLLLKMHLCRKILDRHQKLGNKWSQCRIQNKRQAIWHSLRLNEEVMARAWHILGSLVVGVKIILQVFILFFYVPCKKLTKKWKKFPKSIKLRLCIRYCTDRLTLGHVRPYDRFLKVKLRHLEAI